MATLQPSATVVAEMPGVGLIAVFALPALTIELIVAVVHLASKIIRIVPALARLKQIVVGALMHFL